MVLVHNDGRDTVSLSDLHRLMTFMGDLILPIWLTILLIDIARILI